MNCYWNLCDCPDKTPASLTCTQHGGYGCGYWAGGLVTALTDITDPVTQLIEDRVVFYNLQTEELIQLRADLEQKKAQAEREHRELENQLNNANTSGKRRNLLNTLERKMSEYRLKKQELQATLDDLSVKINIPDATLWQSYAYLRIPFSEPGGSCKCYQTKVGRLAALATQITTDLTRLQTLTTTTWPTAQNRTKASLISLAFPAALGIVALIKAFLFWIGLLSGPPGWVLLAIAVLLTFALVIGMALYQLSVFQDIIDTRVRLLNTILLYYRLQQISTCTIPETYEEDGEEDGGGHNDEGHGNHDHGGNDSNNSGQEGEDTGNASSTDSGGGSELGQWKPVEEIWWRENVISVMYDPNKNR